MPEPTTIDDALLARLNALKKSSVTFDTTPALSTIPPNTASPIAPVAEDSLAARFARLGSASPSSSPKSKSSNTISTNKIPVIAPGAPSYLEGIAEGIGRSGESVGLNEEDEKSLEELLGELGAGEWDFDKTEERDVGKLVRDVRGILPEVQKAIVGNDEERGKRKGAGSKEGEGLTDWENVEVDIGTGSVRVGNDGHQEGEGDDEKEEKKTEDEETDDVIARIMAELSVEQRFDPQPNDGEEDSENKESGSRKARPVNTMNADDDDEDAVLKLPSAPTDFPTLPPTTSTQTIDDALTARFASLSSQPTTDALGLPSAPSFHPAVKPPKFTSGVKHTDEEIETWCIICNDDATLKCLGCVGDLYCQKCWMEGHRGESAGWDERRHKAVLYSKKKKQPAAAS